MNTNTFPTIQDWGRYVKKCQTEHQLNAAVKLLKRARTVVGIHDFLHTNKMGLAIWHLDERAKALDLDKRSDGTYWKTPPPINVQPNHENK